jgi:hypothetical protein
MARIARQRNAGPIWSVNPPEFEVAEGKSLGKTWTVGTGGRDKFRALVWIPAFERVKESLFSLEGGHRAAMDE